jgi:F0F1-type ATP synthase gamma subunit
VYQEVKRAYEHEIEIFASSKKSRAKQNVFVKRPRRAAIAFLSANTSLYGEIISKTFSVFMEEVKKEEADVVVVGRVGRTLFEEAMPNKKFIYFDFPDTAIAPENLKAIATYLNQYEKVIIFHGRFRSIVSQEVAVSSVSGDTLEIEQKTEEEKKGEYAKYLFEPALETIIIFFETEIFGSLLEQVFHESRLAKLASRMILLDRAAVNVEGALKKMKFRKQQMQHRVLNQKQVNLLSGVALWGE